MLGISDVTIFRILVVSVATNIYMTLQLLLTGAFVTSAYYRNRKKTRESETSKIKRATPTAISLR